MKGDVKMSAERTSILYYQKQHGPNSYISATKVLHYTQMEITRKKNTYISEKSYALTVNAMR